MGFELSPLALAGLLGFALFAGVSSGASGIAFAQLMAAGLALAVDPKTAIALLSILVPITAVAQMVRARKLSEGVVRRIVPVVVGGLVGVPLGVYILTYLPSKTMSLALGAFTLLFVVTGLRRIPFSVPRSHERAVGPIVGVVAGVCNGALGASGPIVAGYLLVLGLPAAGFTMAAQTLFFSMSLFRLAGLIALGQITTTIAVGGAALLVPSLVGQRIGFRIQGLLPRSVFQRLVLLLLGVSGIGLVARGLS